MEECKVVFEPIDSEENDKIKLFIPPWALSKEEIPIYVEWSDINITKISISLSNFFKINRVLNSNNYDILKEKKKNTIIIKKLKLSEHAGKSFVGLIIKSKKIIQKAHESYPINVDLFIKNKKLESLKGSIILFRPILRVKSEIKKITIDDDNHKHQIKLKAEKSGFGDIVITTKCSIGGRIVSYGGNILDEMYIEIIHKLFKIYIQDLEKGWDKEKVDLTHKKAFEDINFDGDFIENIINHINDKINEGLDIIGDFEESEKQLFEVWLDEYLSSGELKDFIPFLVRNTLVNIILKYLGENLSESTQIIGSQYKVNSRIKSKLNNIQVQIQYKDLLENEYEPIIIPITIKDKRSNPSKIFIEFGINIVELKDNSIKDIKEIESDVI